MSILTKIIAVLLSVFSLLLVGMVVAFVGNSNNYKDWYAEQKNANIVLQSDLATKTKSYNEQVAKCAELEKQLAAQIQNTKTEKDLLASELRKAERLAQQAQADAEQWKAVMTGFEQSVRTMQASLIETQKQLDAARAEDIQNSKEITQITGKLYETMMQLEQIEAERRRLLEKNKDLSDQVSTTATAPKEVNPVTQIPNQTATPAARTPVGTDIKGLVLEVDENLVTLSIGSADGVKENMLFHITRGERFMCDIIITNVDINRCAGMIDLKVQQPQVNDAASTQI